MTYEEFLKTKALTVEPCGFECDERNPKLFDWQNDVVRWALRKGKCAIFTGCGSGKTRMQLQWAQKVHEHTGEPILILCPLAVAQQTKREGEACGIEVKDSYYRQAVKNVKSVAEETQATLFDGEESQ